MELYQTIFYLLFFSLIFEFAPLKIRQFVLFLWVAFFAVFAGIRWGVGDDWDQYYRHFENADWSNIFSYDRNDEGRLEPGFVFINILIKTLFGEFWIYNLIICSFLQSTYFRFCLSFCPKHPLFLYVFIMLVGGYYFIVRAGLSIAVCYWAFYAINKRKLPLFLLIVGLATLIHYQCIILLPAYWLGKIKVHYLVALCLMGAFILLGFLFSDLFRLVLMSMGGSIVGKALAYTEMETIGGSGFSYTSILTNFFFLSVFYWFSSHNTYYNKEWVSTLTNLFIIQIAIYSVFSSVGGMNDLTRLVSVVFPAQVILIAYSFQYFLNMKRKWLFAGYIVVILTYLLVKIPSLTSGYFFETTYVPYATIFD